MSATFLAATAVGVATRLRADATLVALATGGIKVVEGPARNMETGDDQPYIVVSASSATDPNHSMQGDGFMMSVEVTLFDVAEYTLDRIDPMSERVYGDATLQTDLVPTYGLHRHRLTLPAGLANSWTASQIVCEGVNAVQLEDTRFSMQWNFKVNVSRYRP